tara:strand:- start:1429 stop:1620 length:192 start_codon:yes stop_codon:yes gene_type:complete
MPSNPLDELKIKRDHIIAVHEAYTHTNKKTSSKRAKNLLELLETLKYYDKLRNELIWEEEKTN